MVPFAGDAARCDRTGFEAVISGFGHGNEIDPGGFSHLRAAMTYVKAPWDDGGAPITFA